MNKQPDEHTNEQTMISKDWQITQARTLTNQINTKVSKQLGKHTNEQTMTQTEQTVKQTQHRQTINTYTLIKEHNQKKTEKNYSNEQ